VTTCIDETLAAAPAGEPVAAVAICTFLHGLMGVDREGRAATPVLTWADSRSQPQADRLSSRLDGEEVRQRTGCPLHPVYYPPKIEWLREAHADRFRRVHWWCSIGEYCLWRFTGARACSLSMAAGTGLLDRHAGVWDARLLAAIRLDQAALSPLAELVAAGTVQRPFARRWPMLRDAAWLPALGDNACSSVGCGADAPGKAALMIGTTGALRFVREAGCAGPRQPVPAGLWAYRMDGARELIGGVLGDGGSLFEWLISSLQTGTPRDELDAELLAAPAAAHGLTVLPFLTGERSTGWNPRARGAVIGIGPATRPMEILQAGLEAVAYRFAAILKSLRTVAPDMREVTGTGGALRSSTAWGQILCDVLEVPLAISDAAEASSRGAAILALRARGSEPQPLFRVLRTLTPRASTAAAHRAAFAEQERLLTAIYPMER
jgi:gluconokinase